MKKITAIFLLTIYSLTSLGIGIKQFYCCGKLKSTGITFVQESKEKCSNTNAMKGCCKTTFKSLKVKGQHVATNATAIHFTKYFTDLDISLTAIQTIIAVNNFTIIGNSSHAPPGKNTPLYIFLCTYLI